MHQIKKIKRTLILMLSVAICSLAIMCCMQIAYADTHEGGPAGSIVNADGLEYQFNSHEELNNLCNNVVFSSKPRLTINFYKDLNFEKDHIEVPPNKTYNVNLNNHKLTNDYTDPKNSFAIINVSGSLNLYGQHGILEPANDKSSINVNVGGSVHVKNIDFIHSYKQNYCGGVYFCGMNKEQYFENCTFDCKGHNAGAVYVGSNDEGDSRSKITFLHCGFNNCQSEDFGSVLNSSRANVDFMLNTCSFENCSSGRVGGAIYLAKGNNAVIESCSVKNCFCTADHGGFIGSFNDNVNLTINSSNIDNCYAGDSGGAIYLESENSKVSFNNTLISNCYSDEEGGAISTINDNIIFNFNNSTIENCYSTKEGGAIYVKSCDACFNGAPVSASSNDELVYGLTIKGCHANNDGGAVYLSAAGACGNDCTFKNIRFINNKALNNSYGGAICSYGRNTTVDKCYFEGNFSTDDGGAICKPRYGYVIVTNSIFKDNVSEEDGHEIYFCDVDNFEKCKNNTVYCNQWFDFKKAFNINHLETIKGHFNLVY